MNVTEDFWMLLTIVTKFGYATQSQTRSGRNPFFHWKQIYVSWFLGFLGIRHFQAFSENKIRHFQAKSGTFRHFQGHDFAWSAKSSHDSAWSVWGSRTRQRKHRWQDFCTLIIGNSSLAHSFIKKNPFLALIRESTSSQFVGVPALQKRFLILEAQQRYFSYRAIVVAIVSQNFLFLFLWGIAQLSRDTVRNGVWHRCGCVKLSAKGGGFSTILGEC